MEWTTNKYHLVVFIPHNNMETNISRDIRFSEW